jgi:hypothetical protein
MASDEQKRPRGSNVANGTVVPGAWSASRDERPVPATYVDALAALAE